LVYCDGRRFRVIGLASYVSKLVDFNYPTCIWRLRWGWPVRILPRSSALEN